MIKYIVSFIQHADLTTLRNLQVKGILSSKPFRQHIPYEKLEELQSLIGERIRDLEMREYVYELLKEAIKP